MIDEIGKFAVESEEFVNVVDLLWKLISPHYWLCTRKVDTLFYRTFAEGTMPES